MSDQRTCLYESHIALGAKMVSFGGFEMPLQYTDIADEHIAVRSHCGVFDVSHMGEIRVSGADAERLVQHVFTNDVSQLTAGEICYGMMLYPDGGTVDDLLVYKIENLDFLLVVNAANISKDYSWIKKHSEDYDVSIVNQSDYWAQIALQGPEAELVLLEILGLDCRDLAFYKFKTLEHNSEFIIISRTGYTGEDGFEIYGSHFFIRQAWKALIDSNRTKPCGLGCRDTLRFEVGLPLYGNELNDKISPIMVGLSMFVKLDKREFIGKEAVSHQKIDGVAHKLIGVELEDKAIPRHGYEVVVDNQVIGVVTTGYNSISTGKSVCFALVKTEFGTLGNIVQIRIHRKLHTGVVVKKRFYQKNYKK